MGDWFVVAVLALPVVGALAGYWYRALREDNE